MNVRSQLEFCAFVFTLVTILPPDAMGWNIPTHMVHGAMTYQILRQENTFTITAVRLIMEHHSWHERRWRGQLEKLPEANRDEMLFMLAARWADDVRIHDRAQHRGKWHYVNFPFTPVGEPETNEARPPPKPNILTAMAENTRMVRTGTEPQTRAIALAWLFHLVGDIHQPLHTTQLFSREYPQGDRGGATRCAFVSQRIEHH